MLLVAAGISYTLADFVRHFRSKRKSSETSNDEKNDAIVIDLSRRRSKADWFSLYMKASGTIQFIGDPGEVYREGMIAFGNGEFVLDNPYYNNSEDEDFEKAVLWRSGWLSADRHQVNN